MVEAMPATVKLKDIVDALDVQSDESTYFVDPDTGEVELVSKDLLREAEESGDDDDEGRIFLHGRSRSGSLPSELSLPAASSTFRRNSTSTSGRLCRISHFPWSPERFARIS
jgi:hypothetical protein